jgi:hypothetical protein
MKKRNMQVPHWGRIFGGMLLILCLCWTRAGAAGDPKDGMHFQLMLGGTDFSQLSFEDVSNADPSVIADSEIGRMPELGLGVCLPLVNVPFSIGVEGSVLYGWRSDSTSAIASNGLVYLHIDNDLILTDFSIGPYASTLIMDKVRIYAGAGPLLLNARYEKVREEQVALGVYTKNKNIYRATGSGAYARVGIEYLFRGGAMVGLCLRGFESKLDLDDIQGSTEVKGLQLLMTFSASP